MFLRHSVFGVLISICLAVPAMAAGWSHYGADAGGQRHSAAAQITPSNVGKLKPVWTYRTGDMETRADDMKYSAFEGTP
ncbi:MAG: pyrroloquinoline quinone-dependent dehydrogenase, partial [Parvibaculum sp.]|nr:pyrroloquinoline quinone-dependent dehydrogenase [Parvibaculum sp.]